MKQISIFLILILCISSPCIAAESIETFFNNKKALKALEELYDESSKFQLLAHKIKNHPKYKNQDKKDKFPKDFELYIRITDVDINSIGDIDTESLYLAPAYNRLYVMRYCEFLEYKINKLELELAETKGKSSNEISKMKAELQKKESKLKSYINDDNQWPD
jgi:hypothetical protein